MADVKIANPLAIGNATSTDAEKIALAKEVFSGEVLKAFERKTVTKGRVVERSITSGKSADFPCFGRTSAHYLKAGQNLDDLRQNIKQGIRKIDIDGLLTADFLVFDLDEFMSHYDFRSPYAEECGNALAISHDASVIAEIAKEALSATENVEGNGLGGVITKTVASGNEVGINQATGLAIYELLLEAKSRMSKNHVPAGDRTVYIDPDFHSALASNLAFLNSQHGATGTIIEGNIIKLAGFDIVECPHITRGGDDNTNTIGGVGHVFPAEYKNKKPIIIHHKSGVGVVKLKDVNVEHARRAEYQADQFITKMAEGCGGLRPEACFIGVIESA